MPLIDVHIRITLLLLFLAHPVDVKNSTVLCFNQTLLVEFTKCWQRFIPQKGSFKESDWKASLPTAQQREDWQNLIDALLTSNGTCHLLQIPSSIGDFYSIERFTDKGNNETFCVLYETSTLNEKFLKGWGLFIVPFRHGWTRVNVHYSAAHPITDGPVHLQATAVFLRTRGKSVLIAGLRRDTSAVQSVCQRKQLRADAAHDNGTMFHSALIAIQKREFSGIVESAAIRPDISGPIFLQFHGKADTSCPKDTVFLSTGYGRGDAIVYADRNLPINRLKSSWRKHAPSDWRATTPDKSKCFLVATTNVFGRLLNGVPPGEECNRKASKNGLSGLFIHAEQARPARNEKAYDIWSKTVLDTFGFDY